MNMHDVGQNILQINATTLKEIEILDSTNLKISYFLNCVKITNRLEYKSSQLAREDYDALISMLGAPLQKHF